MKKVTLALSVVVIMASCKKSGSSAPQQKTNSEYLTAHSWQYNKYYTGYVDQSHLGDLVYQRGGITNTVDLSNDFATFYSDGTVDEIANGTLVHGTWKFNDNAQTILQVTNSTGVYTSNIVKVGDTNFSWYYTDIYGVERYAEEVPKQ